MGKKSPPPKAPDLKPITDAQLAIARETNEIAREQLGMSREQFAWFRENAREELALARQQSDRLFDLQNRAFESDQEAKEFARQVGQTQIDAMNLQMDYARRDRERWEQTFLPMQDRYIQEANNYDTPQRREEEAARASVDIQRQAEAARANSDARLRSMGIDPSQVRSATLLETQGVALAAQQAGAMNNARQSIEDRGRAMRADALNVGAGLPAQALAGFAGAGSSGAGAIGAGMAGQQATLGALQGGAGMAGTALGFRSNALNNVAQLTGSPTQWAQLSGGMYGQSSNAFNSAGNMMSQDFNNRMTSWDAGQKQAQQQFNNIMSVASLATGAMMAEGGEVRAPRMAEGGLAAAKALMSGGKKGGISKSLSSGKVASAAANSARKSSALSRAFGGGNDKMSWSERAAAMRAAADPYTRAGQGSGEGGRLTALDRLDNAAEAARQFSSTATNLYEETPTPRSDIIVPQTMEPGVMDLQLAAEGGAMPRARGALPTRQSRDNIPAVLSEGEYVVPADVVRAKGIEFFDKLVSKYHRENA